MTHDSEAMTRARSCRAFRSLPKTRTGGRPSFVVTCAPIARRGAATRSIGRRSRLSSPVRTLSNVLDAKGDPIGALGAGEAVWHTDMSYLDVPPDASMLYALEIPPSGGNTYFCGMQAVWQALPASLKMKVGTRRIKHDGTFNSGGYVRQGVTPTDDPHKAPGAWHPAVCVHPNTGKPALYLGRRRNSHIEGLTPTQSDALLDELWKFIDSPEFAYEHRWHVGACSRAV